MKSYHARLKSLVARRPWPPSGLLLLAAAVILPASAADYSTPYSFTTLAGLSSIGSDDGPATAARFFSPHGVTVDAAGNLLVADKGNHTIRKITPDGTVTTLAGQAGDSGSADGAGADARFNQPFAIAIDPAQNLYVADTVNCTVRKITPAGVVTTLAGLAGTQGSSDGRGSAARFNIPSGIAVDAGGSVYVADSGNNTIRKITPAGMVTTLAGTAGVYGMADGTGSAAEFFYPFALAVDAGNTVYVAEIGNCIIRRVTPAGEVTTLVGPGGSLIPQGMAVDGSGNVFVSDLRNVIRKLTPDGGIVTLAGTAGAEGSADGVGNAARFRSPFGLAADTAGDLFVADRDNNTIRKITPSATVTTIAGLGLDNSVGSTDGSIPQARFNNLASAAIGPAGEIYVADTVNSTIRKIAPNGAVSTLAGRAGTPGSADGTGSTALFNSPYGIAVDAAGMVYVSDPGNDNIRRITPTGVVTTVAGDATAPSGYADGTGTGARFNYPGGLAADAGGNLYVADRDNSVVRKITPAGVVTTLAGTAGSPGNADGTGSAAAFAAPQGVAVDSAGNVYVANAIRHGAIKKISPAGAVTTLAGGAGGEADSADGAGTAARFNNPQGVSVDLSGNVYVAEGDNDTIRKISPAGVVSTLAGLAGAAGNADGLGSQSRFLSPHAVAVDAQGNLYVPSGTTVRKGLLATTPVITTQPLSLSATVGTSAIITVSAAGVPDPTFQWCLNGNAIRGANSRSLAIASVQAADAGDYTVVVTNPLGSVTSTKATLTVAAAPIPPAPAPASGGGGGAIEEWFLLALSLLGAARWLCGRRLVETGCWSARGATPGGGRGSTRVWSHSMLRLLLSAREAAGGARGHEGVTFRLSFFAAGRLGWPG